VNEIKGRKNRGLQRQRRNDQISSAVNRRSRSTVSIVGRAFFKWPSAGLLGRVQLASLGLSIDLLHWRTAMPRRQYRLARACTGTKVMTFIVCGFHLQCAGWMIARYRIIFLASVKYREAL
jgi:hypothetical protein